MTRKTTPKAQKPAVPLPLRLEWRTPEELADNPSNWRQHPEAQTTALAGAIREVGWAGAALYNEATGRLIDGHARKNLPADMLVDGKMPVLVGKWTEEQERVILLTLDPLSALAEASVDTLSKLLLETRSEDAAVQKMLDELGASQGIACFETGSGTGTPAPEPQTDRATILAKLWKTKVGQTWLVPAKAGTHVLHCGDCRTWLAGLANESAAMVFTDPPYGHNNNNGDLIHRREAALGRPPSGEDSSQARPIANDGPEANELFRGILPDLKRLLQPGGCCCCCCGGGPDPQFARWSLWLDEVIPFKMCVVWDKGGLGMGWHYRRCWECILVAEKPGAACKWYGGNDVPNVIREIGKIIPSANQHPTAKPVELAEWFIRLHSQPGDVVLEPFLGGGSTLIGAERLGRLCIGCELDPALFATVLQRAADAGLSPVLSDANS